MPADHLLRQTELAADVAHFVLEQLAQRLDELELMPGLSPPTLWCVLIVTDGPPRGEPTRSRRDRACPARGSRVVAAPCCVASSKTSMNVWPMIVRFSSGSSTPASASRNRSDASTVIELDAEVRAERSLDLLALVKTKQSGVDEDARELIADRAMHERRRHRRVDAAGQTADRRARLPTSVSDLRNLVSMNALGVHDRLGVAHLEEEIGEDLAAARRVRDFGMELHAVPSACVSCRKAAIGELSLCAVLDEAAAAARRT